MVLVIGLPAHLPGRSTLMLLVFGVVGASLLLQGLSMTRLLTRLGLRIDQPAPGYDEARLRVLTASRALTELATLEAAGVATEPVAAEIRAELLAERAAGGAVALGLANARARAAERREVDLRLLAVRIQAVRLAADEGVVQDGAAHRVLADLAEERDALE
jgi:CPA1 family monovalent cation:H+ antiporter